MDYFQDVIRGPYAFLLVVQVLIVAGLLLAIVWFLVERLRSAPVEESVGPAVHAASADAANTAAPQVVAAAPAPPVSGAEAVAAAPVPPVAASIANAPPAPAPVVKPEAETVSLAIGEPMAPETSPVARPSNESASGSSTSVLPEEVAARKEEVRVLNEESEMLRDKVKYLESRLMEYEIVQEEISSLSQLRVENEKLKEEILKAGGGAKPAEVAPLDPANPVLDNVSEGQIDTILKKLDQLTATPTKE